MIAPVSTEQTRTWSKIRSRQREDAECETAAAAEDERQSVSERAKVDQKIGQRETDR